jgi:hypothetical protein
VDVESGEQYFDGQYAMKTINCPPGSAMLESMRSIGYTVEAAVADVIDNSVAAEATAVDILVSPAGEFQVAILDNGTGMSRETAIECMTLSGTSPTQQRHPSDLGRFGLGLKTASLSQCRTLTIITKNGTELTALRWSLDHVIKAKDWSLIELGVEDVKSLLGWQQLNGLSNGTLVHWGELDQLSITEGSDQADLDNVAQRVKDHVALVFHLFNGNDGVRKIEMNMNGTTIIPIDPFMSNLQLTDKTPWESIEVEGQEVNLIAYTLPYLSRLSSAERDQALKLGRLRETQGFYLYRASRLVVWGNWFRVMPRSELAKLTRVRVDIPNSLDHLWALDVKKSNAQPPPLVRKRLSELAKTMVTPSRKVQEFRGRKVKLSREVDFIWTPRENGDEFSYEINIEHPTISSFANELSHDELKQFSLVLEDIQSTFPVADAHNRLSGDRVLKAFDDEVLLERAVESWRIAESKGMDSEIFIGAISRSEPYFLVPDFENQFRKVLDL